MKISIYLTIAISLILFACKNQDDASNRPSYAAVKQESAVPKGKILLEQKCYVCHSPSGSIEKRLAPPMIAVKRHYITPETTKDEFFEDIWNWVEKPTIYNTKMKGAVGVFGIMPYQEFDKKNIRAISDYLFENDLEKPEWFNKHIENMGNKH